MAAAANAFNRPPPLHPPFVPGRLYRIYSSLEPSYLAIYNGPSGIHQYHEFTAFDDYSTIDIRVGQPRYGVIGTYVASLEPAEDAVRGQLEALFVEGQAVNEELSAAQEEEADAENRVEDDEVGAPEALAAARVRIHAAEAAAAAIIRRYRAIMAAGRNAGVAARRNAAAAAATQAALAAEQNNDAVRAAAAERAATASLVAPASTRMCSLPGCTAPAPYTCGRCLSAYYCGPEHQRADWNRHKRECRVLSAKVGGRRKSRRSKRSKRSHRKTKRRHH